MIEQKPVLNGYDLKAMFNAGAIWLERIVPDINALNVYPVPDGDCGTNMLSTIRASLDEAAKLRNSDTSAILQAIAKGALMGARGNSGVILSQMWRGLAQQLKDTRVVNASDLALALHQASETAYLSLSHPVEGTILTVMRDAASAAGQEAARPDASSISVLAAAVKAARTSVINTPNLLAVLKDAGVVDAGGHGLFTFLEGSLVYLNGDADTRSPELLSHPSMPGTQPITISREEDAYGFCTQFMVKGKNLNISDLRKLLENSGKSLIVVGDASTIRVHIHAQDPQAVIKLISPLGTITDVDIRNMDEQHQDFLIINREKISNLSTSVIAVVNGDGLIKIFADFGVAAIVPGGQTMNPSTIDILRTVEEVPSNNIILLPNNKNIIPTAFLAKPLTKKNLKVIPSETIPQGISALIAFLPEADFETNTAQMSAAITTVKTIEITRSTRNARLNNLDIKEGMFIGLLNGELLSAGDTPDHVIFQLLERIDLAHSYIVTLYFGKDANETEANQISAGIHERYPDLKVGMEKGGQPNYHYIISLE